jgi:putative membrane protein
VKLRVVIVALLGLALAIYVVAYAGIGAVVSAVAAVGWSGFALLCLYVLALFIVLGGAWCVLLPQSSLANLRIFIWARMVREAAADVLPFSQLGGLVLGARAAILHGIADPLVYASTIVDVTAEMLAQIAYVAMGVLILYLNAPPSSFAQSLIKALLIGVVCAAAVAGVFLALQRRGQHVVEKFMARLLPRALPRTMAVTAALSSIYRSRARIAASIVLHSVGWIASAIGVWIAFRLIGLRVEVKSVLALEALVSAIRSTAVFIPHALGAQEAAYALL